MAEAVLVDGEYTAGVPADDRGLAYGDGVFRSLRVARGHALAWKIHMQRLAHDCQRLGLPQPDTTVLAKDTERLFEHADNGILKIMITRGSGGRGYTPPAAGSRRIVSRHPAPRRATSAPLVLAYSSITLARQPALAGVKHLNRLEQVLARAECERMGAHDSVMGDETGRIIATTMRNLLFRDHRGRWLTPALSASGVAGATRQRLLEALATQGRTVQQTDIGWSDLADMRAAVACNSVRGVEPVARIGHTQLAESESAAAYCRQLIDD